MDYKVLTANHMYGDHGIDPEGVLSTLPSIAHVLLGFWIGHYLVNKDFKISRQLLLQSQMLTLFMWGVVFTFSGFLLSYGCPINKKIWSAYLCVSFLWNGMQFVSLIAMVS